MTITADTITTAQIRALRNEARAAGDSLLAAWCDLALSYSEHYDAVGFPLYSPGTGLSVTRSEAREVCADAINAAAAMLDDDDGGEDTIICPCCGAPYSRLLGCDCAQ